MLTYFKRIIELINESNANNEKKVNDPIIKNAYSVMQELLVFLQTQIDVYPKTFDFFESNLSVGRGGKNSSPWIGFLVKDQAKKDEGIYITIIFLAQRNSVFLTIQSKSEKLRKKFLLDKIFDFYQSKVTEIKYNYHNIYWENKPFKNFNLLENESPTSRTNSYLYTSLFYDLVDLSNTSSEELFNKIQSLFDIFLKVDIFNKYPEKLRDELNNYLSEFIEVEKNEININEIYPSLESLKVNPDFDKVLNIVRHDSKDKPNSTSKIDRKKHKENLLTAELNGDRAEKIVQKYEKEWLESNNRKDLAEKVRILTTDGDGYDVLSYYLDGQEKKIEVKSTTSNFFYLTNNELRQILSVKNSGNPILIYLVTKVKTINPIVSIVNITDDFENKLVPDTYKAYFK